MNKRKPTSEELSHIIAIKHAVRDRAWGPDVEQDLAEILRVFSLGRERLRKRKWAKKNYQPKADQNESV